MPYTIRERDGEFCVFKEDEEGNPTEQVAGGCHSNRNDAVDHMQALYAAETDKNKSYFESEMLITFGDTVKVLDPETNKIGGYLVRFGDENEPDLEGDYFTKETDFGFHSETNVLYQHGYDPVLQKRSLNHGILKLDDAGVWLETQLEMRDEYEKMIMEMVLAGKLGLSSGTAGHLVERERTRKAWKITKWPLGLDASLTPTPAEPRTSVMTLKSYLKAIAPEQKTIEATKDCGCEDKEKNIMEEEKKVVEKVEETPAPIVEAKAVAPAPAEIDYEKLAGLVAEKLDPVMPVKSAPVVVKAENIGDPDPYKQLTDWMRGENNVKGLGALGARILNSREIEFGGKGTKAALQEGTASEGGNLVPNDFYGQIIAKRDQMSIPRRAGARVIRTSRDVIDIPYEDTSMTNFVLTAEEGAYDENEPTFGNAQVTVYKYTKLVKISEELIEDEAANLDSFLSDAFGRAWGLTENAVTLLGTGSSQPQGVFVGGSVGYTFADTNSITAAEIPALFWTLGDPYHDGAVWVTRSATMGALQGLSGNNFQLVQTPPSDLGQMQLWYKPVFISDSTAAIATGAKTIIVGNWNYYALVERHGMILQRNPYLYQGNGQIGIFAKVRMGGIVLQSEAFKWGIQA